MNTTKAEEFRRLESTEDYTAAVTKPPVRKNKILACDSLKAELELAKLLKGDGFDD